MIGHLFPLLFVAAPAAPVAPVYVLAISAEVRQVDALAEPRTLPMALEPRNLEIAP